MPAGPSFVGDLRVVLRGTGFRRLLAVRLSGQLGDGVFGVALASYVLFSPERQPDAAAVAGALAVVLLPYSLLGPFAGVLLDRWRRRQVLVWGNVVRCGLGALVLLAILAGESGPVFFTLALAEIGLNRFLLAGLSAALPRVVPADELVMANAVGPTCGTAAALAGAGVGFGLRGVGAGDVVVVAVAIGCWFAAAALATRLHRDALGPDRVDAGTDPRTDPRTDPAARPTGVGQLAGVGRGLRDAVGHLRRRRRPAIALLVMAGHRFAYAFSTVAGLLLCRSYLNDPLDVDAGLADFGLLIVAGGVGYALGAVMTPAVTRRLGRGRWISVLLAGAAAAQVVPGALYTLPALLATSLLLGVTAQGLKICVDSLVQEGVDDEFRGRAFSIYDMLYNVAFVGAAVLAAFTLPVTGKSYAMLAVVAVLYLLAAGAAARWLRPVVPATR